MYYGTTGGDIIITIPNCDCGLTGGCEKCQPRILHKTPEVVYTPPNRFSYPLYVTQKKAEVDAHPEWGIKYLWNGKWQ